MTSEAENLTAH